MSCIENLNATAIRNFREYLRIPTAHPDVKYDVCVEFLKSIADELGLVCQVFEFVDCKPIVLMTWEGSDTNLPAILLNSHTDVVPVFEDKWTHLPFEADMDDDGNIFGRGAQDMKCVSIMYLEAIRRLICKGVCCKRTFHLSFVPDEEIGGKDGMGTFVTTDEFKKLNIGFSLDEGGITPLEIFPVFYGESICWQINVHCCGTPGHGCKLQNDTPGEKLRIILNKFLSYRDEMQIKRDSLSIQEYSSVTSVNLTKISGGIQTNVIPDKMTATFDIRISLEEDFKKFEEKINQWCSEAGQDVTIEYITKEKTRPVSEINCSSPFWCAMNEAAKKMNIELIPIICPGMTDSRYIRELGIPAYGFTPINETPSLIHCNDEFVNKDKFLQGINIYMEIFTNIGNA